MARLVFIGEVFGSNDILSFILEINFLIQFVIQWNLHEPMPGTYDFEERLDVEAFIKMAQVIQFHFFNVGTTNGLYFNPQLQKQFQVYTDS